MIIVPRKRTSMSEAGAAKALADAYANVLGRNLTRQAGELLLAQIWQETGAGVSCNNNNPGNMSCSAKYTGWAWRPPWFDVPTEATTPRNRELHDKMLKGTAPSAFRAFETLTAGMADHVRMLAKTFPTILAAADTGVAMNTAKAIYDSRYCRDKACQPENNVKNIAAWQKRFQDKGTFSFLPLVSPLPPDAPPGCPQGDS